MIRKKICGMRDAQNILDVAALKPDFMGFIFYPGSRRYVGRDFRIPEAMPNSVERVGVFVNEPVVEILETTRKNSLGTVQLHGWESRWECELLKSKGLKVVKTISISDGDDFRLVEDFCGVVDYFLFDAKGKDFGGNGLRFDWGLLQNYTGDIPYWLGGGVSIENVGSLLYLQRSGLQVVDINSGSENRPGVKNVEKVREIFDAVASVNSRSI